MRAFLFFQMRKTKLRTGKSKLPHWVSKPSVLTSFPFVQQPLFFCQDFLSISYNQRWMQKDGEDIGKLYHGFHHTP